MDTTSERSENGRVEYPGLCLEPKANIHKWIRHQEKYILIWLKEIRLLCIMDTIETDKCSECEEIEYEDTINPAHFDLRFTFSNQDKDLKCLMDKSFLNRCKHIYKTLVHKLRDLNYFYNNKYITCFEVFNKSGESCKAHIHIRFMSVKVSESIRRAVKRLLEKTYDQNTKGNSNLMFKAVIVRNEEEWWRYPLKQNLSDLQGGFTKEQLLFMHEVSKASFEKVVQVHQAKMDKKDISDTLFSRLCENLKKSVQTESCLRIATSQFYAGEDRPINIPVMAGYVRTYQLKQGLITHEELWANVA